MPEKSVNVGSEYFLFLSQVFKSQKIVADEWLSFRKSEWHQRCPCLGFSDTSEHFIPLYNNVKSSLLYNV